MRLKTILKKRSRRVSQTSFGGQHGQDAEKTSADRYGVEAVIVFRLTGVSVIRHSVRWSRGHNIERGGRCRWYRGIQVLVGRRRFNGGRGSGDADSGSTVLPSVSAQPFQLFCPEPVPADAPSTSPGGEKYLNENHVLTELLRAILLY